MATYDEIMSKSIDNVERFIESNNVKYTVDELLTFTGLYVNHFEIKNLLRIIGMKDKKKTQIISFKKVNSTNLDQYKKPAKDFLLSLETINLLLKAKENFEKLN